MTMNIEKRITSMLRKTQRNGIDGLIEHMQTNGFFISPCSGGHHLACNEGLAEHSYNVWLALAAIKNGLWGLNDRPQNIPVDSLIIVSLLHDLGKMGDYGKRNYEPNVLKSGAISSAKPFITNPDLLYIPHEIRSIKIASKFIDLTEEEEFAILYHNGLYGDLKYAVSGKETPLYLMLHMADMWASRVMEKGED